MVEETEEDVWEGGKLAWQVKYQHAEQDSKDGIEELSQPSNISTPMAALSRLRHRLEVGYLCIIEFYELGLGFIILCSLFFLRFERTMCRL